MKTRLIAGEYVYLGATQKLHREARRHPPRRAEPALEIDALSLRLVPIFNSQTVSRFRLYPRPVPLQNGLLSLRAKRSKPRKKVLGVRAACPHLRVIPAKTLGNDLPYYFFLEFGLHKPATQRRLWRFRRAFMTLRAKGC